jgi:hypothetical protein
MPNPFPFAHEHIDTHVAVPPITVGRSGLQYAEDLHATRLASNEQRTTRVTGTCSTEARRRHFDLVWTDSRDLFHRELQPASLASLIGPEASELNGGTANRAFRHLRRDGERSSPPRRLLIELEKSHIHDVVGRNQLGVELDRIVGATTIEHDGD